MEYDTVIEREYICEVCDKVETLTEQEAYMNGWDYPPFIGVWGILSPRTCPDCGIENTAYWHLMTRPNEPLSEKHIATVQRIVEEQGDSYAIAG